MLGIFEEQLTIRIIAIKPDDLNPIYFLNILINLRYYPWLIQKILLSNCPLNLYPQI